MVAQWFYQTAEGQQSGPIDSKELRKLVFAGIVKSNTLVRKGDSGGWVRAANVPGLFQLSTPVPSPSLGASPPPIPPPVALSTSQMRQEAELARRRRADREPKATGGPPVQEPASVSVVESWASTEFGRYVLATAACGAILLLYVIACGVFEWKRGGGAIPMLMLMGAMTATWKAITGSGRRRKEQMPQSPSMSNAAQPQRPAPAVVSKSETKEATQDLLSPLAPKSFMWHAGRLFAHCSDVCTARPKILVIGACIATAGILVLIAVMSSTYHAVQTSPKNDRLAERLAEQIEAGTPPIGVSPETFKQLKNAAKERFEQLPGVTEHQRTFEQLIIDWVDDHQGQPLPEQHVMSGWIQEMRAELRRELVASPEFQTVLDRFNHIKEPEGLESAEILRELERLTQQWALRRMDADQLLAEFERKYQRWLQDSQEVNAPAAAQEPRNPFQEFTGASAEARSHYLRGLAAAHNQEDFESAVQQFTEAIRIDPDYAEAYVARGCARLHNFNEFSLAIEDHTRAIVLQPDHPFAYLHRADTYLEEGQDYLEALNDCNKAISLSPGFAHAFWLRSQVLTKLEEHERAKFDLERAEQLGFVGDGRWYPWQDESWQYWQTLKLKDFSIEIPDGWISASSTELREYEKLMKARMGISKSYYFGVQPTGQKSLFVEPPFILGTFEPNEKTTDREIKEMAEELNKKFQSVDPSDMLDTESEVLKNVFDNSTITRPYVDLDTNYMYSVIATQTPAYGPVHAVTVQRFSPHGAVVLHAYVSDNSKKKHIRVINRMMSSISFSPSNAANTDNTRTSGGTSRSDPREKAIRARNRLEHGSGVLDLAAEVKSNMEIEARRKQRAYAESNPDLAPAAEAMISNLGKRDEVLKVMRQMNPQQREEALYIAGGLAQKLGDDRGDFLDRAVNAINRVVTHGWANPFMELVGIGGTAREIEFIKQLDEIALQEFHPYRPGDPWYVRVSLQAIETLPWLLVIGALIFMAYRWKARSAQMKHAQALELSRYHAVNNETVL